MKTIARHVKQATLAALALSALGVSHSAFAIGTAANTSITSRATVEYAVGGVTQTAIESSPTGNSTPGLNAGVNTAFVVDNKIDLTVNEVSGAAELVNPGQTNAVAAFRVTNTGNNTQGYQLAATNESGTTLFGNVDNIDTTNLRTFVDSNNNGVYDAGVDTATNVDSLITDADGESVIVFVVADVPLNATNTSFANVRLQARAAVAGTAGATLVTQSSGADNPATVEVVFADAGRDATEAAADQFDVNSASLSVTKTATVISDPFNNSTNPKAIPGAVVEYAITVANTGAVAASTVKFTDAIPTNTAFQAAAYGGAGQDIRIAVTGSPTITCTAATDGDGCAVSAGVLTVDGTSRPTISAGGSATVSFRVTIQ